MGNCTTVAVERTLRSNLDAIMDLVRDPHQVVLELFDKVRPLLHPPNPVIDPLLQHIHRQGAGAEDFVVEAQMSKWSPSSWRARSRSSVIFSDPIFRGPGRARR
jgi:hypothetical protein